MHDSEYKLLDIVGNISKENSLSFSSSLNSNLGVKNNYHRVEYDTSWINIMEDTLRYIDNILRNPKKFIINEEEIVKVEKSKKVTVESVIHLSQHTNLITDYDELSGEVKPSKILNVLKEETLDTYENRFIYSLIINMTNFVNIYGGVIDQDSSLNTSKVLNYEAKAKNGDENINITLNLSASENKSLDKLVNGLTTKQRVINLREKIADFTNSDLYKNLARMHVPIVRSPIRKTNVILKNPNFQRAEALWNYMERFDKDVKKEVKYNRSASENPVLKEKMDLSFLIDYSILNSIGKQKSQEVDWDEINLNMLKNSIKNYLDSDPFLNETKFLNMVKKEFKNVKKNQQIRFNEIKKIIESDMKKFEKQVSNSINIINNI